MIIGVNTYYKTPSLYFRISLEYMILSYDFGYEHIQFKAKSLNYSKMSTVTGVPNCFVTEYHRNGNGVDFQLLKHRSHPLFGNNYSRTTQYALKQRKINTFKSILKFQKSLQCVTIIRNLCKQTKSIEQIIPKK